MKCFLFVGFNVLLPIKTPFESSYEVLAYYSKPRLMHKAMINRNLRSQSVGDSIQYSFGNPVSHFHFRIAYLAFFLSLHCITSVKTRVNGEIWIILNDCQSSNEIFFLLIIKWISPLENSTGFLSSCRQIFLLPTW